MLLFIGYYLVVLVVFCGARFRNLVNNCDKGDSLNMDINLSTCKMFICRSQKEMHGEDL